MLSLRPRPRPRPPPGWWTAHRTLAVVGAGLGLASIGVGAAFGASAISAQNQQKSNCGSAGCPNFAQAQEDYKTAGQNATVSTVGFVAAGAFLAGAAVLWFTGPTTARSAAAAAGPRWGLAPGLGDRAASVVLGGEF